MLAVSAHDGAREAPRRWRRGAAVLFSFGLGMVLVLGVRTHAHGTVGGAASPSAGLTVSRDLTAAEVPSTLPVALRGIQDAFLSNDATRLARVFTRRGPVYVCVPPLEAGGFLAPGPMKAFLQRLVRDRVSTGFELPSQPGRADEGTAAAFVRVKWTHRPAASDTLQVDYLHLALRYAAEDTEWQIVEIRTSVR
jgi:hypothetical protein